MDYEEESKGHQIAGCLLFLVFLLGQGLFYIAGLAVVAYVVLWILVRL